MITNLRLNNLKALLEADIPLASLNLFTGLNAVGKSTVIQALLLLRQSLRDGSFSKGLFLKDENYTSIGLGKDLLAISAAEDASIEFEVEWAFEHVLKLAFAQAMTRDVLPLANFKEPGEAFAWQESTLFDNNFQYLSANRLNPQTTYDTSPYFVDELKMLGKEGQYTVHFLARNQDEEIPNPAMQHPKASSNTLLDNVNAWMSDITHGVKVNATYYEELEKASLDYRFETATTYTPEFKPTNVGFGLTYALPVITALLIVPPGGMVLVENPESHLHPAGQSLIARMCAKAAASGVQVFLESHSDHTLNGIRVAVRKKEIPFEEVKVYFMRRELNSEEHTTEMIPIHIDEDGRADEWPKGFFDEWDKQLDLLLD